MTEHELKKLRRSDLLEILQDLSKENEVLRAQLDKARTQLTSRTIAVEKSGSLAEAALRINGVFEACQAACDQYTQNLQQRVASQEQICQEMEENTRAKCTRMISEAEFQADKCIREAYEKASAANQEVSAQADEYAQKTRQEADEYSAQIRAEADAYAQTTRNEASAYSREVRAEAEEYSAQTRSDAETYGATVRAEAESFSTQTRANAEEDAAKIKQEAEEYDQKIRTEADAYRQDAQKIVKDLVASHDWLMKGLQ